MKLEIYWLVCEKYSNIKFHENPSSGSLVVPCEQTDLWTDMTMITFAFRNSANAPMKCCKKNPDKHERKKNLCSVLLYYRYSALGPVWAETRAQSGDWYGSGTLHPGQILRCSLPLLSPAFRHSTFHHNVPPRPPRRERSQRWNCGRECCPVILSKSRLPRHLEIFYMPQIYDMGPTTLLPLRG
jgi:hypothetical protein